MRKIKVKRPSAAQKQAIKRSEKLRPAPTPAPK